jgi:exopolyphosphatase / guanosine-5'-triphosphate,3'-diphosphate pyrophosphatase
MVRTPQPRSGQRRSSAQPRRRPANGRHPRAAAQPAPDTTVVAAIDVGSRALRLAVGEIAERRPVRRLEVLNAPVAIGNDTFSSGRIRFATTEAVVRTLSDFITVARGYGVQPAEIAAVATTAVRDARNRDVFLDRVEQRCGLRIRVIEAIEETRLIHQLVRQLIGPIFDRGTCLLLSLGAGGTQIILQRDGEIVFGETRHFGALQLWNARRGERSAISAARRFLQREVGGIQRMVDLGQARSLIVINRELYQLLEALVDAKEIEAGLDLHVGALDALHAELDGLPADELVARSKLDYPTVEGARMALEELKVFADYTSSARITVPAASMLDSLLFDAKLRIEGAQAEAQLARQVDSAAAAVGRKYHFDEPHARQVQRLAQQLFDGLRDFTHLTDRARLILGVAALLHDIGYYVSFHDHERHSAYLIEASEIIGLSRRDLKQVALVSRFHRRPAAELESRALDLLPAPERVELLKLSALLRMADALDDDGQHQVEGLRLELTPDLLRVYAETRAGDRESFASIEQSFRAKADLFSEVFGIEPTLTEVIGP